MTELSDASLAELLAENKAQLSDLDEDQGLGEDVLVRTWTVGQDDLNGCLAYLKAQTTIASPMTGTRWARTGTWYAGEVKYKPGNVNPLVASGAGGLVWVLYQTLSKGDKIITINEDNAAFTRQTIIHTYNPDIPSGTAAAGKIVRVEASPTELGRERTSQETTTPKDQVATAYDRSKAADATKILHTENATPLTLPADIKGTIVRQSAQPTEAGNDRTTVDTIVPKDQVATAYDRSKAADATKVVHSENATPLTQPADVKGTIVRQSAAPTEAGNDRTTVDTIVPKDQVATAYDDSAAAAATKVVHTENETPLVAPTPTPGTIVRQSAQPTEAGNERTQVETIVAIDQVATSGEDTALHSALKTVNTENASPPAAPPTRATNTTVETDSQPTESGRRRTMSNVRTAKPVNVAEYVSRYGADATDYLTEIHHDPNAPAIVDQTASGVETAVLSHELDDYLTRNYRKLRSVKKYPLSAEENVSGISWVVYGDYELATSQVFSVPLGRYWNDHTYVYQRIATYTMRYFATATLAAAFIGGTVTVDNSGSHISNTGPFEWLGIKIVHTKTLITTYNYTEPTV